MIVRDMTKDTMAPIVGRTKMSRPTSPADIPRATWRKIGIISARNQLILWLASAVSSEGRSSELLALVPPFLGPGFRLGARWNRLGEAVKTRKKRVKTG